MDPARERLNLIGLILLLGGLLAAALLVTQQQLFKQRAFSGGSAGTGNIYLNPAVGTAAPGETFPVDVYLKTTDSTNTIQPISGLAVRITFPVGTISPLIQACGTPICLTTSEFTLANAHFCTSTSDINCSSSCPTGKACLDFAAVRQDITSYQTSTSDLKLGTIQFHVPTTLTGSVAMTFDSSLTQMMTKIAGLNGNPPPDPINIAVLPANLQAANYSIAVVPTNTSAPMATNTPPFGSITPTSPATASPTPTGGAVACTDLKKYRRNADTTLTLLGPTDVINVGDTIVYRGTSDTPGSILFQPSYNSGSGGDIILPSQTVTMLLVGSTYQADYTWNISATGTYKMTGSYTPGTVQSPTPTIPFTGQTRVVCPLNSTLPDCQYFGPTGIQQAADASSNGDKVYLHNGTYTGVAVQFGVSPHAPKNDLIVQGESASVILDGNHLGDIFHLSSSSVTFLALTLRNAKYNGITVNPGSNVIVKNSIFYQNGFQGVVGDIEVPAGVIVGGNATIINNTFYNDEGAGISSQSNTTPSITATNNILTYSRKLATGEYGYGLEAGSSSTPSVNLGYNLFFSNAAGCATTLGWCTVNGSLNDTNPLFISGVTPDLRLQSNSPALHAGDPTILNPDGTRSNIGAYGGADLCKLDPTAPGCPSAPVATPTSFLPANTCQCDIGQVTENNCTPPNTPSCTSQVSCICSNVQ